ncbi:MAG: flagellar biosynthesis protein FlgD [Acidobacteria bacterium]|nr:flagellar biosynthesis protein FlgD [Acidobacteriota bacterium]
MAIDPFAATSGTSATSGASGASTSKSTASATNSLANENTFLQLFIAQLKNQDPMNPQDGTQFVAQLATFSNLEQVIQMRQDIGSIKTDLESYVTAASGAGSSTTSSGSSSSTDSTTNNG